MHLQLDQPAITMGNQKQVREKGNKSFVNFTDLSSSMHELSDKLTKSDLGQNLAKGLGLLENLAHHYVLKAFFVDMDWTPTIGSTLTLASFLREHKLNRDHKALINSFLSRLEQDGILVRSPSNHYKHTVTEWKVAAMPPSKDGIRHEIKQLQTELLEFPECKAESTFLCHIANQLYDCLNGTTSGIGLLFPPSDSRNFKFGATTFYENSVLMRHTKVSYMEEAMLQMAHAKSSNNNADGGIRILEVGAGTGGTTLPVLEKLVNNTTLKISYTFTDISSFFVTKAKPRFEKLFPMVDFEFKLLDIETDPIAQGYIARDYDIIMVADVYHATQYLDDTVVHTRQMLKSGGVLVLGEIFQSNQFLDCTFGLTEGWWRFADERKESPLVSTNDWNSLLKAHGFVDTFAVTEGAYGVVFALADAS